MVVVLCFACLPAGVPMPLPMPCLSAASTWQVCCVLELAGSTYHGEDCYWRWETQTCQ